MSSYTSPLESLAAFAIAFVTDILSALGLYRYIKKIKQGAQADW